MPEQRKKFSPEFRDEAIKMVIESSQPIARIARDLNIKEGTLGNWVNTYRREHAGEEPPLTVSERARLRELEKEVRELRMKAEFLGKRRPSSPRSIGDREVRVHRRREGQLPARMDVRLDGHLEIGILRMARPSRFGHGPPPGRTQGTHSTDLRRIRRNLRLPAHPRRTQPPRRALRPRAPPRPGAGTGPGRLPAATMAADHDPRR